MVIAVLASSLPVIVEPAPTVAADPARTAPPVKDALVFAPVINQRELAESIHY